jgi:hypothetical protein
LSNRKKNLFFEKNQKNENKKKPCLTSIKIGTRRACLSASRSPAQEERSDEEYEDYIIFNLVFRKRKRFGMRHDKKKKLSLEKKQSTTFYKPRPIDATIHHAIHELFWHNRCLSPMIKFQFDYLAFKKQITKTKTDKRKQKKKSLPLTNNEKNNNLRLVPI